MTPRILLSKLVAKLRDVIWGINVHVTSFYQYHAIFADVTVYIVRH